MTRARVAQKAPPADLDLTGFPTASPHGGVFRAHSRDFGPWYFSKTGNGRFDLTGDRGTCYAADTVRTAVRERLGESCVASKIVAFDDADAMTISILELPNQLIVAAISAPGAGDFPVTSELSSMSDYSSSQAWASRFATGPDTDFAGIAYRSRFAISDTAECWAIFGPAGPDQERLVAELNLMDGHSACVEAGLTVTPPPPTSPNALTVTLPPGVTVVRRRRPGQAALKRNDK